MSSTVEKVREILAAQLDVDVEKITAETNIAEELGADSLDLVELMMSVEEEFDITIEEDRVQGFKTVADVANYIDSAL
ncbi:MAG: acyl carrier protein [Oscillospiraceae bacterium]|jgi:acyl carrier protein|nr:acyl carrier protein [Oscillospiraceae bacterium]